MSPSPPLPHDPAASPLDHERQVCNPYAVDPTALRSRLLDLLTETKRYACPHSPNRAKRKRADDEEEEEEEEEEEQETAVHDDADDAYEYRARKMARMEDRAQQERLSLAWEPALSSKSTKASSSLARPYEDFPDIYILTPSASATPTSPKTPATALENEPDPKQEGGKVHPEWEGNNKKQDTTLLTTSKQRKQQDTPLSTTSKKRKRTSSVTTQDGSEEGRLPLSSEVGRTWVEDEVL